MGRLSSAELIRQARERLESWLGKAVEVLDPLAGAGPRSGPLFRLGSWTFAVTALDSSSSPAIEDAVRHLLQRVQALRPFGSPLVPVLVTPFLGPTGQEICRAQGVSWLDLSGNADIRGEGLRLRVSGEPNRFVARGRPSNPFAPKSARLVRWFLENPNATPRRGELAVATGLSPAMVHHAAQALLEGGYLREHRRQLALEKPQALLSDWRERYDFGRHRILRGHIVAREGMELAERVGLALSKAGWRYAATGLAGAWLLDGFAQFRTATFFVAETPPSSWLAAVGFRTWSEGANTWLVVPDDEGVFLGAAEAGGMSVAHPVQVYLDLKGQAERAPEAAQHLWRSRLAPSLGAVKVDPSPAKP